MFTLCSSTIHAIGKQAQGPKTGKPLLGQTFRDGVRRQDPGLIGHKAESGGDCLGFSRWGRSSNSPATRSEPPKDRLSKSLDPQNAVRFG
jgi:hypothetical protein